MPLSLRAAISFAEKCKPPLSRSRYPPAFEQAPLQFSDQLLIPCNYAKRRRVYILLAANCREPKSPVDRLDQSAGFALVETVIDTTACYLYLQAALLGGGCGESAAAVLSEGLLHCNKKGILI